MGGRGTGAGRPPVHAASPILFVDQRVLLLGRGVPRVRTLWDELHVGISPPCSSFGWSLRAWARRCAPGTPCAPRWPPPGLCDWTKRREVRSAENSGIAGWQGSSRHVGGEKVRVTPGPSGHERATAAAPGPAPGDAGSGKARFDRTNDPRSVPPTGWAGQIVLNASCRAVDAP